jgi:hypothetical protein
MRRSISLAMNSLYLIPQVTLNFNLSSELVLNLRLLELLLVEDLQGNYELALAFAGQVHITKLALTQAPSNIKV